MRRAVKANAKSFTAFFADANGIIIKSASALRDIAVGVRMHTLEQHLRHTDPLSKGGRSGIKIQNPPTLA